MKDPTILVAEVGRGDLLYLPPYWWHQASELSHSIHFLTFFPFLLLLPLFLFLFFHDIAMKVETVGDEPSISLNVWTDGPAFVLMNRVYQLPVCLSWLRLHLAVRLYP